MFLAAVFLKRLVLTSLAIIAFGISTAYALTFQAVKFESYDGTMIDAQLFKPTGYNSSDESYPAMVLVPGWTLPKETTYENAIEFARRGFVVLSYSPRGFWGSEGLVNVAGPNDRDDFSAAIDWLLDNSRVDIDRIGSGGVSYGGIVPGMGTSFDNRISALAMMDFPAEVLDAFYQGETPNKFWTQLLEFTSRLGNPDPEIRQNLNDLFAHRRIPELIAWAEARSPMQFIDNINDRQLPVFISLNYRDRMFRPNSGIRYFEALTGPKKLQLHDGIHGMPDEAYAGYRSNTYFDWFDYWLNDADNGVMDRPIADFQLHRSEERVQYYDWPSADISDIPIFLSPNDASYTGDLLLEPDVLNDIWLLGAFFSNMEDEQPTSGQPLTDAQTDIYLDFSQLNPDKAHTYQSNLLPNGLKLRGAPTVNLRIQSRYEQVQVVAYLYQVNPDGQALYLTHGARTLYDLFPGELVDIEIEMTSLMYDFEPGTRLGLAFDTQDPQFVKPPNAIFNLDVIHSGLVPNTLWLPVDGDVAFAATNQVPGDQTNPGSDEGDNEDGSQSGDRATASNSSNSNSGGSSGGSINLLFLVLTTMVCAARRSARRR